MEVTRRSVLGALGGAATAGVVGAVLHGGGSTAGSGVGPDPTALVAGSLLSVADGLGGAAVEAHGSAGIRRLILDGACDPDAVALADPRLFDGIGQRATLFGTNALVLAYAPGSPVATRVKRDWRAALAGDGVALGRTDPAVDPLGYRTVMALRLAARAGDLDADRVLDASTVLPETDLLNVLDGGRIDAAFAYRNMAVERDLPHVSLPDRIDFSDPAHAETYATVSYDLPDATVRGAPIRYAATALTGAGAPWVERLVTAGDLLRDAGFLVPEGYPRRAVRVGDL